MLESTFLGLWIFGWNRLSPRVHLATIWIAVVGTWLSGYFILAVRAVGLDAGPMGGFDAAAVDAAFWAGTAVKTNFICTLGHGDPAKVFARSPRLSFEEACKLA